jgi:hypothetical protein
LSINLTGLNHLDTRPPDCYTGGYLADVQRWPAAP